METLYAFGSNGSGQLGVGHCEDLSKPERVLLGDNATTTHIRQLAAGGNHTFILFENGTIKSAGNDEDGRAGVKGLQEVRTFTNVEPPASEDGKPLKVKQVAATWASTTISCDDGRLYVCGSGNSGELGLGPDVETTLEWKVIPNFPPPGTNVLSIASSMAHTLARLSNGAVYGWGKGRKGQIGEPREDVWSPRRITDIEFHLTAAACGKDFTIVIGAPGRNEFRVLGGGNNDRFNLRSNAPASSYDWIGISASWCSIYAPKETGEVVAWGRDDHGQLPDQYLPAIEQLAAGSEHCLALTKTGKVLAWGWGEHGNCGRPTDEKGDVKDGWNQINVTGRVTSVFAGCATSFILADE